MKVNERKINHHKSVDKPIKRKRKYIVAATVFVVGLGLIAAVICVFCLNISFITYRFALNDYKNGDYDNAIKKLTSIKDYSDSAEKLIKIKMEKGAYLIEQQMYDEAISVFECLDANRIYDRHTPNPHEKLIEAKIAKGAYLMGQKMYDEAILVYEDLNASDITDKEKSFAEELGKECRYQKLLELAKVNPDSYSVYELYLFAKTNYKDSREQLNSICTQEWLFNQLRFSNVITHVKDVKAVFDEEYRHLYENKNLLSIQVEFLVGNSSWIPIEGSFSLEVNSRLFDGAVRNTIITISKPLYYKHTELHNSEIWLYAWEGDSYWSNLGTASFGAITNGDGLKIVFD